MTAPAVDRRGDDRLGAGDDGAAAEITTSREEEEARRYG
jgi:hypothetical protein